LVYLTGEVAKKYKLQGKDLGLEKVIDRFVNKTSFTETLFEEQFYNKLKENKKEQVNLAISLLKEVPLESEERNLRNAKFSLSMNYLSTDLKAKYDIIKPGLLDLKRIIEIKDGEIAEKIKIPLFADAYIRDTSWEMDKEIFENLNPDYDTSNKEIEINSKTPMLPKEAKEKIKGFTQDYFIVFAKAFGEPIIGDLLLGQLNGNMGMGLGPSFEIHWIPKPSEINVKIKPIDPDPIITSRCFGDRFLIYQWRTKDEEPYEHYLREFRQTRGQMPDLN